MKLLGIYVCSTIPPQMQGTLAEKKVATSATSVAPGGSKPSDADHKHDNPGAVADDPEVVLMLAFQAGDESAFVQLYQRYRNRIVAFSRRFLGDVARAEEAAQDIFLKLYSSRVRYQPRSRFSSYLYRIASNHCMNLSGRADQRLTDRQTDAGELAHSPAAQVKALAATQLRRLLREKLGLLAEPQRMALLLCHFEGLSNKEAAAALGVSVSATKSLLFRARERMIKELGPHVQACGAASED